MNDELRRIPKVDVVLGWSRVADLTDRFGRNLVKGAVQNSLRKLRERVREGKAPKDIDEAVIRGVRSELADAVAPSLKRVINGTGIIIHTNLGRAVLPAAVLDHMRAMATHYCNLEYDLKAGERGHRDLHAERLLARFFNVESACVVNNNAAAVMLMINTFAEGKEVVVSRGELVEIGGSFRIPEIMKKAGARLVEVGTTNKTHLKDYASAIGKETGLVLKVHPSNYRLTGFTSSVDAKDLAALCAEKRVPFAEDMGSGNIHDLKQLKLMDEPEVRDSITAGVGLVSFSGDKLFGGIQSGIIIGRAKLMKEIRANHLLRALRVDKLTYSALEKQLILYLTERFDQIPTWNMLYITADELRNRAVKFRSYLPAGIRDYIEVVESRAKVGGGTTPEQELSSIALSLTHPVHSADKLSRTFRNVTPPVVGRIEDNRFLLDMRTILDDDLPVLNEHVRAIYPG